MQNYQPDCIQLVRGWRVDKCKMIDPESHYILNLTSFLLFAHYIPRINVYQNYSYRAVVINHMPYVIFSELFT